jgi:hypothetical protein
VIGSDYLAGRVKMPKYLLTCGCGRELSVDPGQAGESLRCECGATIAVPTLRQLRQLPAACDDTAAAVGRAWSFRHGAIAVSLILAVACLLIAGLSWLGEPKVPMFDPAGQMRYVDQEIDKLTPVVAWRRFVDTYQPLAATGFTEFKHPMVIAAQQEIERRRLVQLVMVTVAAICVAAAAAIWVGTRGPSTAKTRRHGDKPTRRN